MVACAIFLLDFNFLRIICTGKDESLCNFPNETDSWVLRVSPMQLGLLGVLELSQARFICQSRTKGTCQLKP